jgi:hypothetical protein
MRHLFTVAAALLIAAAETAALACTCIALPADAAERRALARDVADGAVALVEVELERPYDATGGAGERLRVVTTLAGSAPAAVEVERSGPPDGERCDLQFRSGERVIVMLYPPQRPGAGDASFRLADKCLTQLVGDATFRAELVAAMAGREERGAGA